MRYTRLISVIALLLVLVMSFTSCSALDTVKGVLDGSINIGELFGDPPADDIEQPEDPGDGGLTVPPSGDTTPPDGTGDPDDPSDVVTPPAFDTPSGAEDNTDYPEDGKSAPALDSYRPLSSIPEFAGEHYTVLNGNRPYFLRSDLGCVSYSYYSELDSLGRAGMAVACVGTDIMPDAGSRKDPTYDPTGWVQASYSGSIVTSGSIWNRSHLIAWSLAADSGKLNLVTGTPYFNQLGMTQFEDMVRDYVKETGNHVLYRVTPVFVGDELVCRGVTMEAYSIEDNGGKDTPEQSDGICFNVFMHNVNPGIDIDYATGETSLSEGYGDIDAPSEGEYTFILNTAKHKIHMPDCSSVTSMSDKNKEYTNKTVEELIADGYSPCGTCHPEKH